MVIAFASQASQLHLGLAALVLGALIGVAGHVTRLRWLVLLGILVVGLDAVLFAFVLRPGAGGG